MTLRRALFFRVVLLAAMGSLGVGLGFRRPDLVKVERLDADDFALKAPSPPVVSLLRRIGSRARRLPPGEASARLLAQLENRPTLCSRHDPLIAPAYDGYDEGLLIYDHDGRFELLRLRWKDRDTPGHWQLRRPLLLASMGIFCVGLLLFVLRGRSLRRGVFAFDLFGALVSLGSGWVGGAAVVHGELIVLIVATFPLLGGVVLFGLAAWRASK